MVDSTKTSLLQLLNELQIKTQTDELDQTDQQELQQILQTYSNNHPPTGDNQTDDSQKNLLKYLFTGWWLHTQCDHDD
jgi:hypothetical protein